MTQFIVGILIWCVILFGAFLIWAGIKKPRSIVSITIGIFVLLFGIGLLSPSKSGHTPHPLPAGMDNNSSVLAKGIRQSKLSYEPQVAAALGEDMDDTSNIEVMKNPKTKRFVFNYKIQGKTIPVYAIYARVKGDQFNAYLIPVKDNKIYSILIDGTTADKQINATTYYGFSYDDMIDMNIENPFDGSDHPDSKEVGDYLVYYK
ncbi:hypothetical protein [Levilactobacillus andaensis]|uniref:hypothetical protein n=1 Tax=Levilactobacillus andaensis TaxID=2799570 RepID=UPI0019441559|nr:hypothetical protein [Levilactobacillus andaensis]